MNPLFNKYYGIDSKNRGPFLAFSQEWFSRWQHWLLFMLNAPVLRLCSRWILRIHRDCNYSDPIIEIQPDNYKVLQTDGQIRGDFRTHPKFSKRIYFAFRWWWWILHYLDEAFKPAWMPDLSFGFDTLTSYPSAGASSPCDGVAYRWSSSGESFSTIIAGAGTNADYSGTTQNIIQVYCSTTTDKFKSILRSFFNFSTNIGSDVVISYASFSFYVSSLSGTLTPSAFQRSPCVPTCCHF